MANAPGKSHRKGMTFVQTVEMFNDEEKSRKWFEEQHWPDGPFCPHCGSFVTSVCQTPPPPPIFD